MKPLVKLPTGDLFAAIRTGMFGYTDRHGQRELDEPLLAAWSRCDGRRWSEPTRIYLGDNLITGIYPKALVTSEGVLAVMKTRPYGGVVFSPDGSGTIWTDEVRFSREYERRMATMSLIGPNTMLVVYLEPQRGAGTVIGQPITVTKEK